MKTLGIGVDIIENSRIKRSISNKKFLLRIFSNDEILKSKKTNNKACFGDPLHTTDSIGKIMVDEIFLDSLVIGRKL